MSSVSTLKRGWRQLLTGLGAAALAAGCIATVPATSAEAAPVQTITGKLVFSANKKLDLSKNGYVSVYTSSCKWVDADVKVKGNAYRVTLPKAGRYRVVYTGFSQTSKSPYGMQSAHCAKASSVLVGTAKTVKRDLSVTANGKMSISGVRLKSSEYIVAYSGSTPVNYFVKGDYGINLRAGTYRLAVAKWDSKRQRDSIVKVFGTRSKSLSKGKTVKLGAARALTVNFDRAKVSPIKTFSYAAKVKVSGSAKVGQVLTADRYKFPSGTKFTYQWSRYNGVGKDGPIKGATGSKYRLTSSDAGATVTVSIVAKRTGYMSDFYTGYRTVSALRLTEITAPVVSGADDSIGAVGQEINVTPATYAEGTATANFWWYDEDGSLVSTEASYTPTESDAGRTLLLFISQYKKGYSHKNYEFHFTINGSEPEGDQHLEDLTVLTVAGADNGVVMVGDELVATPATFVQEGVEVSYAWTIDGEQLLGDEATFTPLPEHAGQFIQLNVMYSKPGYHPFGEAVQFQVVGLE